MIIADNVVRDGKVIDGVASVDEVVGLISELLG